MSPKKLPLVRYHGIPRTGITRDELDLQDALAPQVTYYDWQNTSAACIAPVPEHPGYRCSFSEYIKNRDKFVEADLSDKTRLTFHLPRFQARISSDIASGNYRISFSRFITHIIEVGLITFQIDYHDKYHIIKSVRSEMVLKVVDEKSRNLYMQLDKMTISLDSSGRAANGRQFSPAVPTWLYNAINDTSVYLNMSKSDVVFLCWNIGMKYSIDNRYKSTLMQRDVDSFLENFEYELTNYSNYIYHIHEQLTGTKPTIEEQA